MVSNIRTRSYFTFFYFYVPLLLVLRHITQTNEKRRDEEHIWMDLDLRLPTPSFLFLSTLLSSPSYLLYRPDLVHIIKVFGGPCCPCCRCPSKKVPFISISPLQSYLLSAYLGFVIQSSSHPWITSIHNLTSLLPTTSQPASLLPISVFGLTILPARKSISGSQFVPYTFFFHFFFSFSYSSSYLRTV